MTISLEEFGLSKYESSAYLALIYKGTISASDLAYYSGIPRTKIYSVLLKLEKKRLVIISRSKPLMCTAIGPENAFNSIIQKQMHKVNAMNAVISDLKEINLNNKNKTVAEKIYHHVNIVDNFLKIKLLFDNAKSSIKIMLDRNGMNILSKCKQQLITSMKKNINIQIIVPPQSIGTKQFKIIPDGIKIHMADALQNCFIFDNSELLLIDNEIKTSVIFHYDVILNVNMLKLFTNLWTNSYEANNLYDVTPNQAQEIYKMILLIQNSLTYILKNSLSNNMSINLIPFLEQNNIFVFDKKFYDVLNAINLVLHITCVGHIQFDYTTKNITLESKINNALIPWTIMLNEYLHKHGYTTKIFHKLDNMNKIHIKIIDVHENKKDHDLYFNLDHNY